MGPYLGIGKFVQVSPLIVKVFRVYIGNWERFFNRRGRRRLGRLRRGWFVKLWSTTWWYLPKIVQIIATPCRILVLVWGENTTGGRRLLGFVSATKADRWVVIFRLIEKFTGGLRRGPGTFLLLLFLLGLLWRHGVWVTWELVVLVDGRVWLDVGLHLVQVPIVEVLEALHGRCRRLLLLEGRR